MSESWKVAAQTFFDTRAQAVRKTPSSRELCYVSARDSRLWADTAAYEQMIASIVQLLKLEPRAKVLEVGCAAGFLAQGIAPRCGWFIGIDVAEAPLRVARRLGMKNAEFRRADGSNMPFKDGSFDRAFSYDVFTNLPDFSHASAIVEEMLRVVRPGGRVLVGSIPDATMEEEFCNAVARVQAELDAKYGPVPELDNRRPNLVARVAHWFGRNSMASVGQITCYYFRREDFLDLGERLGVEVEILPVHPDNVYADFRFNVRYTLPSA